MKQIRTCSPELLTLCGTYIIAASMEYWLVNWIKEQGINLPVFFAIVQNAAWPLQLYFYHCEVKKSGVPRVVTKQMWTSYIILGTLASVITMTRMAGLSSLPASLYVICANTETVFETLMTRTVLKRKVRPLQWMAAFLVCCGVVVALYDPDTRTYGAGSMGGKSKHEQNMIIIGVLLSIGSRWASALNVILAEKLLGKDAKSKIGVSECATANAIIPFCLVPSVLIFDKEYKSWGRDLYPFSRAKTTIVVVLLVSLSLAKNFDRAAKFGIVSNSSTIFFAGIDAFMKVVAGIGSFLFFGDVILWPSYVGFVLVVLALICLFIDKRNHMLAMKLQLEESNQKVPSVHMPVTPVRSRVPSESHGSVDGGDTTRDSLLEPQLIVYGGITPHIVIHPAPSEKGSSILGDEIWPIEEIDDVEFHYDAEQVHAGHIAGYHVLPSVMEEGGDEENGENGSGDQTPLPGTVVVVDSVQSPLSTLDNVGIN